MRIDLGGTQGNGMEMTEGKRPPRSVDPTWGVGQPLRLEGVCVMRGGAAILSGIDLEFDPGRRYVIVGPSGSGKSTLLRLFNRLEDPAEGRITIGGRDLRDLPIRSVRKAVGLVFQSPRPLPGTVAENLAYPFEVRGHARPDSGSMAGQLEAVGLDASWLGRDASGLSGGERQRLGLAVALAAGPEILALDEPTSALDPSSSRRVAELLADRAESTGLRTIAVTHHRGHALMLGDTAIVLERGRVVAAGPVGDILERVDGSGWAGATHEAEAEAES